MKNNDISEEAKEIFSDNLRYYMKKYNKSQADISTDLGFTASTVSDWANGKKYARVDKMQALADYFGIYISDLREKKKEPADKDELIDSTIDLLRTLPDDLMKQAVGYIHALVDQSNRR